ncbi:hypothetical protein F3Y22_tig00004046pilonHSYRG00015 [Hibiscus syriacus]|uniref:Uncharacterized protein n=1 Tax=Hibiscus syriacus TaxID=106335 RepID=A0A6A3CHG4_HIBSY|nr:hypothetical protein F3Y22_tig00004046pilonHSYRG00015 [Hibiscus syriacus]
MLQLPQFGGGFIAITGACLGPGKRLEFGESSSYVVTHPIAATWTAVLGSLEVSVGVVAAEVEAVAADLGSGTAGSRNGAAWSLGYHHPRVCAGCVGAVGSLRSNGCDAEAAG